jgi:glycosyltransferase involved in cell wall biosynthesis
LLCAANGLGRNPWKDFSTLTTAVASLPAAKSGQKVIVVALGETQPPHQLGTAEVYYPGFITPPTQLTKYYQAADLFLHFAKIDTFPTVVLEALACGLPVIASNVGGIPEQIQSAITWRSEGGVVDATGATGVLIDKGNVAQAIAAISFLIDNAGQRNEISTNAARAANINFAKDGMVKKYALLAMSIGHLQ